MNKEEFEKNLLSCETEDDILDFSRKHIIHGIPYVFEHREDEYFEFRNRISKHFNVAYYQIYIVGSGKLGFSYRKDTKFGYDSDIDVAIVSEELFDKYLKYLRQFQYELDQCKMRLSKYENERYARLLRYIVKGWIRPDLLPANLGDKNIKKAWFDYFRGISYDRSEVGNYKVNAGIYKNYDYLEYYNVIGLKDYINIVKMEREEKDNGEANNS